MQFVEEAVPRHAIVAKIPAGVVLYHQGNVELVFEVLLQGLDHRNLAGQCHVKDVGSMAGLQTDAVADVELAAVPVDLLQRIGLLPGIDLGPELLLAELGAAISGFRV